MDRAWKILRTALAGYVAHGDISRGAAIAFFAVTSLAPVLLVITAIAGLAFGEDSVRAAISAELNDLVGGQGADLVKSLLANSTDPAAGTTATLVGIVVLVATASGVFGEMQTALNTIWNVRTSDQPFYSLIHTRAASLGLVAALGFLMIVSLAASTALSAIGHYLSAAFPLAQLLLATLNTPRCARREMHFRKAMMSWKPALKSARASERSRFGNCTNLRRRRASGS